MENDESDDLEIEQQDEDAADDIETTDEKVVEESQDQSTEDSTDWKAEALKQKAINLRLSKKLKTPAQAVQQINNSLSIDPEELRLIARQFSDEEIEQARIIAKGTGTSLSEAVKNPLFEVFQKDLKDKQRKEKAKLGAAKGSGQEESSGVKPDMSQADHKEVWRKAMGR
jgi:hypothetical protein